MIRITTNSLKNTQNLSTRKGLISKAFKRWLRVLERPWIRKGAIGKSRLIKSGNLSKCLLLIPNWRMRWSLLIRRDWRRKSLGAKKKETTASEIIGTLQVGVFLNILRHFRIHSRIKLLKESMIRMCIPIETLWQEPKWGQILSLMVKP